MPRPCILGSQLPGDIERGERRSLFWMFGCHLRSMSMASQKSSPWPQNSVLVQLRRLSRYKIKISCICVALEIVLSLKDSLEPLGEASISEPRKSQKMSCETFFQSV